MAYIAERSEVTDWCRKLREDEREAEAGGLADVVRELDRAKADYAAAQKPKGQSGYPYNSAMGTFLGLPLRDNHEPPHGYYMAGCVAVAFKSGNATRELKELIAEGRPLRLVTARSKKDRKPVRFAEFRGAQIQIVGNTIELNNGKRKGRLSSNWSGETCLEAVAKAMRNGGIYGESQP